MVGKHDLILRANPNAHAYAAATRARNTVTPMRATFHFWRIESASLRYVYSGAIPLKDAAILLYGFQIASANVSQVSRLRRLAAAKEPAPLANRNDGTNSDEVQ